MASSGSLSADDLTLNDPSWIVLIYVERLGRACHAESGRGYKSPFFFFGSAYGSGSGADRTVSGGGTLTLWPPLEDDPEAELPLWTIVL